MSEETVFVLIAYGADFEDWSSNIGAYAKQDYAEAEAANLNAAQIEIDLKLIKKAQLVSVWMKNNPMDFSDTSAASEEATDAWLKGLEETEAQIDTALGLYVDDVKWCQGTRFKVQSLNLVR